MEYKKQKIEYRILNYKTLYLSLRSTKQSRVHRLASKLLRVLAKTSKVFPRVPIQQHPRREPADSSTFNLQTSTHRGVATLPTVMVLGVMALIVAVSVTTLAFTDLFISQGSAQSSRAHFYAEAGARDALTKIARKKSYLCSTADCYSIDFSTNGCSLLNDCAKVQVTGSDTAKVVTSRGIMKSSARTLQVNVTLDADGLITATTWSEVTI